MKLFVLAAVLPLAGLLLAGGLGILALGDGRPGLRMLELGVAGFLVAVTGHGLVLAFRSWPAPEGLPVDPAAAPELRNWLRIRSASWQGPVVHRVRLEAQGWSADLIGTPVLGLLGWTRHSWVLGLYPLLALSPREFEAVVSWEVVWWSAQQGWLNLQLKRLANHWQATYLHLGEAAAPGGGVFRSLWRSYARFMVRRFEGFLVRECLWADFNVAQQHGAATYARALCRLAILRPLMERRILPELVARLQGGEPLPESLYGHLVEALGRRPEAADGMLELALDGLVPEAPALLRLRLAQLGVAPAVPLPPVVAALGPLLEGSPLLRDLEQALRARLQAQLDRRAQRQAEGDRRFRFLEATVSGPLARHPGAIEYLQLAFDRLSAEAFWDALAAFCADNPSHPDGSLLILRWTLRKGWLPQAEAQMEQIRGHHPFLAPACHRLLAAHHRDRGAVLEAERHWNLARRAEDLLQRARRERGSANLGDSLEPHGCGAAQLEAMVSYLESQGDLAEAFLVRKKVVVHPERPVLLLVVSPQSAWWDPGGRKREACQARLERECPFPGQATGHVLVARAGFLWRYRRRLTGLGALILDRPRPPSARPAGWGWANK